VIINWHPFDRAAGTDAYTNATLYRALRGAAALERAVGTRAAARADRRRAAALRRAMLSRLWDRRAGAFVVNAADPRDNHTQDAQVQAVLAGVTGRGRSRRALRFIDAKLLGRYGVANGEDDDDPYMSNYISPFISGTELLARMSHGDTTGALRLIRRTWGRMLAQGPGTLWEKMSLDGRPANYRPLQAAGDAFASDGEGSTSLAHGWSGGPVPALSGYVLGLRPRTAGWRTWTVAPQPGDLRDAQGRVETPHGTLASRWVRAARSFKLTVVAPRGTGGTVVVPTFGRRRRIAVDGRVVRGRPVRGGVAFRGAPGTRTYAWAR
jgi:alpha-L-rhamnosidase